MNWTKTARPFAGIHVFLVLFALLGIQSQVQAQQPKFAQKPTFDPPTLFLTWQGDPTTTMTVQWISEKANDENTRAWYAKVDQDNWQQVKGEVVPFGKTGWHVHRVEMTGLSAGTDYRFRLGEQSPEYRFATVRDKLEGPLVFAAGGDAGPSSATRRVCQQAAKRDVEFVLLGGDIAYANGHSVQHWVETLTIWRSTMVGKNDRIIPTIFSIGNHEVRGGFQKPRSESPLFNSLFKLFDEHPFNTVDFGDYMSVVILDTDHTTAYDDPQQLAFLEKALAERENVPHLFALYHQPMYPGHRDYNSRRREMGRRLWVPLFDKYKLDAAFENDDHMYKRAPLLKNHKPHPEGTLYIGDGCWGRSPRPVVDADEAWWVENSRSIHHCVIVTIDGKDNETYQAISDRGDLFDSWPLPELQVSVQSQAGRELEMYPSGKPVTVNLEVHAERMLGRPVKKIDGKLYVENLDTNKRREIATFSDSASLQQKLELKDGKHRLFVSGKIHFADDSEPLAFATNVGKAIQLFPVISAENIAAAELKPGLKYKTYRGKWNALPDFDKLDIHSQGITSQIDYKAVRPAENEFGIVYSGYLKIDQTGVYHFSLASDDGSKLYLGDRAVIDHDGTHKPDEKTGTAVLEKGYIPFRLEYFDRSKGDALEFKIQSKDLSEQSLPENMIFHKAD